MSENIRIAVPVTKWGRWTGSNQAELEALWATELEEFGLTLAVDSGTGNLVARDANNDPAWFWDALATQLEVGEWRGQRAHDPIG
jgi:hypothetical protein